MQLKYAQDIKWNDLARIENPFFASSTVRRELSKPLSTLSGGFGSDKNPLDQIRSRGRREIDRNKLRQFYKDIEEGKIVLVHDFDLNEQHQAFKLVTDVNQPDKSQYQVNQNISSCCSDRLERVLLQTKKPFTPGPIVARKEVTSTKLHKQPVITTTLAVVITNYDGASVKDVNVIVQGLGKKLTNEKGIADFSKVKPGKYKISAVKKEYSPEKGGEEKPAETIVNVKANTPVTVALKLHGAPLIKKENLILVGSEMYYDSFWWKMMFIAPAFAMVKRQIKIRPADITTIAYVDNGYTKLELLPFELLKNTMGVKLKVIKSEHDIINYMKNRPSKKVSDRVEQTLLQDVAIFCHGFPGQLSFNYRAYGSDYDLGFEHFKQLKHDIFTLGGKMYSYACRTGISEWDKIFKNDAVAKPENSLAQQLADHFKIDVYAFLTKTLFRAIIRDPKQSDFISNTLKTARQTQEGKVIPIPPDHEGLPHPGLANDFWSSTHKEGTNEYALWRKEGAIKMPYAASSPKGLSKTMRRFTPR